MCGTSKFKANKFIWFAVELMPKELNFVKKYDYIHENIYSRFNVSSSHYFAVSLYQTYIHLFQLLCRYVKWLEFTGTEERSFSETEQVRSASIE